jgi:hypothetical protein
MTGFRLWQGNKDGSQVKMDTELLKELDIYHNQRAVTI